MVEVALVTGASRGLGRALLRLMTAFASEAALASAWREAVAGGYLAHEFGDAMLVGL